ncbi:hypothetical protein [Leifsonia poae]|uniref:hypothetical protein n=1 Tax=Leifsonia poae TaxID=110933 RepID=UPI001CC111CB|nr:hypothetical protein [Leifsonia poae]
MELLFVALGGALLGLGARYFLPHRHTHGAVLIPAVGVMVSSALWVALTWAGLAWNGGWIWWITLVGTAVIVFVIDLIVGRVRTSNDDKLLATLTKGAVAR